MQDAYPIHAAASRSADRSRIDPYASFAVADVYAEYERLCARGVVFTQPPTEMGPVTTAVLDDTCGNLIQLITLPA